MPIRAVDLFCGVGGLTHGLQQAGVEVIAGVDMDPTCEWGYERNNNSAYLRKDVASVSSLEVSRMFGKSDLRLLAGCAPCQPFSMYGRTRKRKDERWSLLFAFEKLVRECRPELITMENVPGLLEHEVFSHFLHTLKKCNYFTDFEVISCEEYGLPQTRKRLVLVASLLGPIKLPSPSDEPITTVHEAISHLPPIQAGETHQGDRFHISAGLSALNLERIRASRPGGSWKEWPEHLVAQCHKSSTGKSYPSVYGRMEWNKPSPTITTQCHGFGNGRFGHPEQDRAISLREAAMLQSFPETWEFVPHGDPVTLTSVGRMIGNAVPPLIGKIIGDCFGQHVAAPIHS